MRSVLIVLFFIFTSLHASETPLDPCEQFLAPSMPQAFPQEELYRNMGEHCRHTLRALVSQALQVPERVQGNLLNQAMRSLSILLTPQPQPSPMASQAGNMILYPIFFNLQDGILEFRRLSKNLDSLYPNASSYLSHLQTLMRWVNAYIASFYGITPVGFEGEFYLAQIRFGTLDIQVSALQKLIELYRLNQALWTQECLRTILSHPNRAFREIAMTRLKQEGVFSSQVLASLDEMIQRSLQFSPKDPEFQETIEVLVNLLSDTNASKAAEKLQSPDPLQKRGAIQTLGQLDSTYAFEALLEGYTNAGGNSFALLTLFATEIVRCTQKHPERRERAQKVFRAMAEAKDQTYQRSGIFGLGELLSQSQEPHPKEIQFLRERLAETTLEDIQTEIILALSKLNFDYYIAQELRPYVKAHSNVGIAAALYLARVNDSEAIHTLAMALTFPENRERFKFSLDLQISGLTLLAQQGHIEAQRQLLALWERCSRAQKRRITATLLSHCEDKDILSQLTQKISSKN